VKDMAKQLQFSDTRANATPTAKRAVPDFVPKWMVKPDQEFDPARALRGAVRMGNVELAGKLVQHYNLDGDVGAFMALAQLNKGLLEAKNDLDVEGVRTILEQGASPNAAVWNGPKGEWYPVLSSAITIADSCCWTPEKREAALQIGVLLIKQGAPLLSFCDSGGMSETYERARFEALGREYVPGSDYGGLDLL
jgi:hypothetical protein